MRCLLKQGSLGLDVTDRAASLQALVCFHAFEAMALAGVLTFARCFCGGAIRVAFACVHAVAMHFIARADGGTFAASRCWRSVGRRESQHGGHGGQRGDGSRFHGEVLSENGLTKMVVATQMKIQMANRHDLLAIVSRGSDWISYMVTKKARRPILKLHFHTGVQVLHSEQLFL
jgi:hypothetical protein